MSEKILASRVLEKYMNTVPESKSYESRKSIIRTLLRKGANKSIFDTIESHMLSGYGNAVIREIEKFMIFVTTHQLGNLIIDDDITVVKPVDPVIKMFIKDCYPDGLVSYTVYSAPAEQLLSYLRNGVELTKDSLVGQGSLDYLRAKSKAIRKFVDWAKKNDLEGFDWQKISGMIIEWLGPVSQPKNQLILSDDFFNASLEERCILHLLFTENLPVTDIISLDSKLVSKGLILFKNELVKSLLKEYLDLWPGIHRGPLFPNQSKTKIEQICKKAALRCGLPGSILELRKLMGVEKLAAN